MRRNLFFLLLLAASIAIAEAQVKTEAEQDTAEAVPDQAEEVPNQVEEVTNQAEEVTNQAEAEKEKAEDEAKLISGMSILGNQEAPKSLVIVPWKSSELGNAMDISTMLDDSRQPVDKEVFMRALKYYEVRSGKKP